MPLSVSPVPTQELVGSSTSQGQSQVQVVRRQVLPKHSITLWRFALYRLGIRLVRTGCRLQSFVEVSDATTD